jgi:hypothetical protein
MKKIVVFGLVLLNSFYQCNNNLEIKNIDRCNYFELVQQYEWEFDKTGSFIGELQISDSLLFYGVSFFRKEIYKVKLPSNSNLTNDSIVVDRIGRRGQGPCEYVSPLNIDIYENLLYYIDNLALKCIDLEKDIAVSTNIVNIVNNPFIVTEKYVIANKKILPPKYAVMKRNAINIYSRETGEIISELYEIDEIYEYLYHVQPGDICYDKKSGVIYACYASPFSIFMFKDNLDILGLWNFEDKVNGEFNQLTSNNYNNLKNANQMSDVAVEYSKFHKLIYLDIIESNNKKYLIAVFDKDYSETSNLLCYLINDKGDIIDTFIINDYIAYGTYKDRLYLIKRYEMDHNFTKLNVYKINK